MLFYFLIKIPTVLAKWSDNCIDFCVLPYSGQNIYGHFIKMKKSSNLLPAIVIAGLGTGLIAGCCTCPKETGPVPIVVYAAPIKQSGSFSSCPGTYTSYVTYTQAPPQWGWYPV